MYNEYINYDDVFNFTININITKKNYNINLLLHFIFISIHIRRNIYLKHVIWGIFKYSKIK